MAQYLAEAIDSVLAQSFQDFEVILVDDGSTDNTREVAEKYGSSVIFYYQENRGPSAARNRGLSHAQGDYVVFLDADDVLLPAKLETQLEFLENHLDIDVVYSNGHRFTVDLSGNEIRHSLVPSGFLDKTLGSPKRNPQVLALRNAFPINAAMARIQCIREAGGFDETLRALEDWDLWYRIGCDHNFAYLDEYVAGYRVLKTGISYDWDRQMVAIDQVKSKIEASMEFAMLRRGLRSTFYYHWGLQALKANHFQVANRRFRKAIALTPVRISAWLALGLTLSAGKQVARAFEFLRRLRSNG